MRIRLYLFLMLGFTLAQTEVYSQKRPRLRELDVEVGIFSPGKWNAITDVDGVLVGQQTLVKGDSIRTGVTAIRPHRGDIFQHKVPAGLFVANGYGKLAGSTQILELGNLETPIILTNTLSVAAGMEGVIRYTLRQPGNEQVRSVNAVVGETNDGYLNDIRGMHVQVSDVITAIRQAQSGPVAEGCVGAGTGTICFGYKGGIGTSSRVLPASLGGYTVGVLVQSNFGGVLNFAGLPLGKLWERHPYAKAIDESDGSCMVVVATDAPLDARNLQRLARRAFLGIGRTGGYASNGSGDYVIAFSTFESNQVQAQDTSSVHARAFLKNPAQSPLFLAAVEATEEAILNSLLQAESMQGHRGSVEAIDIHALRKLLAEN